MNNFYKLFKPLNPIEFDGERTSEYNLKKKYLIFLKLLFTSNKSLKYLLILFLQCLKGTTVLILVILYSPLATVLYFLNFRFLHINTSQIGAYIQEIDTLIKNNILQKNKKKIVFLCPKFLLINNFVHKLYPKKELIYFENIIIYFLLYPLMHTNFLKLSHWDYETTNPISKFNQLHLQYLNKKKRHNVKLRKLVHEDYLLSRFSEKYKIGDLKKIIIIQVRDNDFYSGSTATTRNSDIKKLKKTIKYLIKENYFVIRYVSLKRNKLIIKNSKYIELSIKNEKDKFLQYLLCKHCRLVICYQGGISSYNQLLDTQFLLINSIPININILINPINRLILKKIYFVKAKKYLNCNQIIKDKLHLNLSKNTLKSKSVKLEENSELEIFNALKETFKVNLNSTKLQKKFISSLPSSLSFSYSPSLVCNSFLKKNKFFLEEKRSNNSSKS